MFSVYVVILALACMLFLDLAFLASGPLFVCLHFLAGWLGGTKGWESLDEEEVSPQAVASSGAGLVQQQQLMWMPVMLMVAPMGYTPRAGLLKQQLHMWMPVMLMAAPLVCTLPHAMAWVWACASSCRCAMCVSWGVVGVHGWVICVFLDQVM